MRPGYADVAVVNATESEPSAGAWLALCPAAAVVRVPGGHLDLVREPAASRIARLLEA